MSTKSRTSSALLNIVVSVGMQVLLLLLSFVSRTIFIRILGEQYLGISGLYSNILSMMSLADLGINTVMIYALYKPIADKDTAEILRLVVYFKRLYCYIALAVLVLGLLCVPFLPYIIKGNTLPLDTLQLYFILYLANTVCSYFIVYKTTIVNADQRLYLVKIVDFVATLSLNVIQIVILYQMHNFTAYLIANVGMTVGKNLVMSLITRKMYPFLNEPAKNTVSEEFKFRLKNNIKSIFLYRISSAIMNSTANILISLIIGTIYVGYYSNYMLIVTAINTFIMLFAQSVLASLGNFNAMETADRKLLIFRCLLLIFYAVATFVSCCFVSMFNDFIMLWLGRISKSYVFSDFAVYAITFNFFVGCVLNPIWMYRETSGLFNQVKYSMMFAAIINIILSFILGKWIGVAGIVAATALSKLATNFWFEPKVLFSEVFHDSSKKYWLYIARLFAISLICIIATGIMGHIIPCSIAFVIVKIVFSFVITAIAFTVMNVHTREFDYIKQLMLDMMHKKRSNFS